MGAFVSEQRVRNTSNMFKIVNRKSYVEEIHKKRVFRYKSIADAKAEEGRIRQVTEGIEDIAEFIEDHGWKIFVAVALGFALAVGGGVALGVTGLSNPIGCTNIKS
eukprot:639678_1